MDASIPNAARCSAERHVSYLGGEDTAGRPTRPRRFTPNIILVPCAAEYSATAACLFHVKISSSRAWRVYGPLRHSATIEFTTGSSPGRKGGRVKV